MRSIFVGIILLSASMAVVHPAQAQNHRHVHTAQAQKHPQRPPAYGYVQTPMGHEQTTNDDLKAIEKDNRDLDLPAKDHINGAGQVHSEEEGLTKKIEQDNARLDRLINGICPSCGAEGGSP